MPPERLSKHYVVLLALLMLQQIFEMVLKTLTLRQEKEKKW